MVNKLRISFLANCTIKGLILTFQKKLKLEKIDSEIYFSEYKYVQEILDEKSVFNKQESSIVYLILESKNYFDFIIFPDEKENVEIKLKEKEIELVELIEQLCKKQNTIIINSFQVPGNIGFGIYENKSKFNIYDVVDKFNIILRKKSRERVNLTVVEYNNILSKEGKKNLHSNNLYYLADICLNANGQEIIANEYLKILKLYLGIQKKCLVLDLDNTLWGGVLGEDGAKEISLSPTGKGSNFFEFQKYIKKLSNVGIILALNSKNNYNETINFINHNENMVLKEKDFAVIKINWEEKTENLISIAKELNIGLDSIVFFDDDPFQRNLIKESLPEIEVIEVPENPANYVTCLSHANCFEKLHLTKEDLTRNETFQKNELRKKLKENAFTLDDYLEQLETKLEFKINELEFSGRIAQMTQKTNQFNFTTKRYTTSHIEKLIKDKSYKIITVNIADKFNTYGVTGLMIIKKISKTIWYIDTFLMSCRVLGRKIHHKMMDFLIQIARNASVIELQSAFVFTEKNSQCEMVYEECGFELSEFTSRQKKYSLIIKN